MTASEKRGEQTSTATCRKCGHQSTWGGEIKGPRTTHCSKCHSDTSHFFMPNKSNPTTPNQPDAEVERKSELEHAISSLVGAMHRNGIREAYSGELHLLIGYAREGAALEVLKKCAEKLSPDGISITLRSDGGWSIGTQPESRVYAEGQTLELCIARFAKVLFSLKDSPSEGVV